MRRRRHRTTESEQKGDVTHERKGAGAGDRVMKGRTGDDMRRPLKR